MEGGNIDSLESESFVLDLSPCLFVATDLLLVRPQVLPDDFHVQTLFVGQPRVACSLAKTKVVCLHRFGPSALLSFRLRFLCFL